MNQPDIADLSMRIDKLTLAVQEMRERLPVLVPVEMAAERLAVSTRTIRRWVKDRRIPFVKLGNVVRIDLTEVRVMKPVELDKRVKRARGV